MTAYRERGTSMHQPTITPPPRAVEEHWITVGGTSTRYLESGKGSPVLLLHGEGGVADEWHPLLERLATSHRVIAVDLPGYGYTEPIPDVDNAAVAAFSWDFVHALGLRRIAVIGHSLGGAVAVHMVRQRPDGVPSLVLVSSAGMGRAINPGMVVLAATPLGDLTTWLIPRLPFGPEVLVTSMTVLGSRRAWRVSRRWWASQVKAVSTPGALATTLRSQRVAVGPLGQRHLLLGQLRELSTPTLVIWGVDDLMVPAWQAVAARRSLRHGQLKLVPFAGHLVVMEAADEVAGTIRPFLTRTGGNASVGPEGGVER
ncbi:alpha/beta hydrolase [Streptomyces buecherae]|uniref:alpha/beta hydrolase n=1 Tax=Streptomyces buecherae TaxID=2763006 RepID=UPI00364FADB8